MLLGVSLLASTRKRARNFAIAEDVYRDALRVAAHTHGNSAPTSRRMAGGVLWSYGGSIVVLLAQVAYSAVTARLLQPSAFGAYASANALISLLAYFSFPSLGAALARMAVVSRSTVGTALGVATTAGAIAGMVSVALAGLWATAWDTPNAAYLIVLWAPAIALTAMASIPLGLLRRSLRYGSAAGIETLAPLVGFAVGAVLVVLLRTPSGLVIGQVANAATLLGAGLIAIRHEIGLPISRTEARGLVSFSGQVSAQSLAQYGIYTLPGLVIARSAGSAALGFFSRASLLVQLPANTLTFGISRVLYPVIAQVTDPVARQRALSDVVAIGTFLLWPFLAILAGSASLAVRLLFGPGWEPAAELIPPLCLFAALNIVYVILYHSTESVGWLRIGWTLQAMWAAVLVLATLAAWHFGADPRAYLYVFAGTQLAIHAFQVVVLSRRGLIRGRRITGHELVGGAMSALALVLALGVNEWLEAEPLVVRVAGTGALTVAFGLLMLLALPRVAAGRALARRGLLPGAVRRLG